VSLNWQLSEALSSESSAWNHKIKIRFSFDDYKRRVKYAIKQCRSRGGAFPIVEEFDEDSSDSADHDSKCYSDRLDAWSQKETQQSSLVAGRIANATTADCSRSHQSSISATPPRSSISDESVILQLSSSGGVLPLPLRQKEATKSPVLPIVTSKVITEEQQVVGSPYAPTAESNRKCQPLLSNDGTKHSPIFRVRWDLNPLLHHALEEDSLLPLHVAVLYSASSDIVRTLVDAYPLAALRDVCGMLPIHFVSAGWLLPPLQPNPNDMEKIDHSLITQSGVLENLSILQDVVPDSLRIRSGNNGMKPEEYVDECMEESSYKDGCLHLLQERLNILPNKEPALLFDMGTSITSSSDDIFDFNDTIHSSADDYTETKLDIRQPDPEKNEPPFEYLSSLMATRDWYSVYLALEMYPSLASKWIYGIDEASASIYKRLPLHCACIYGGPIDLIEKLIQLHPEGIKMIDPTDSSTPLSLACFANCSIEIIQLILRMYPDAIEIVNVYGQAPLHVAILSKVSHEVVKLLVEEANHLVLLKDNDGLNALDYAKIVYGEDHTVYRFLLKTKDALLTRRIHC
jgi:hypothetical protein